MTFESSVPHGGFTFLRNEDQLSALDYHVVGADGVDHSIAPPTAAVNPSFGEDDGRVFLSNYVSDPLIYRVNTDGTLDATFEATTPKGNLLAQQHDGGLIFVEPIGGRQKKTVLRVTRLFPEAGPLGEVDPKNVSAARSTAVRFDVTYRSDSAINASTVGSSDIRLRLPGGATKSATLFSKMTLADGRVRATYKFTSPGGFTAVDNGRYGIRLLNGAVADSADDVSRGREIGSFIVRVA